MAEQHAYSGRIHRIVAYLLDALITMVIFIGVPVLLPDTRTGVILESVVMTIAGFAYYLVFENMWSATPGKKIMGLKMLTTDFEPISFNHILKRRALPFLLSIIGVVVHIIAVTKLSDEMVAGLAKGMLDPEKIAASKAILEANPFGRFSFMFSLAAVLEGAYFLLNHKRQAVHDLIAGTIVVHK